MRHSPRMKAYLEQLTGTFLIPYFRKLEKLPILDRFYFSTMNNKSKHICLDQTFIGIDVSKESLSVFVDSVEEHFTCPNQMKDLTALARRLRKLAPVLIVLEATGGYESSLAIALSELKLPFAIVYPLRVRQFAHGLGLIAKNDEVDARLLAYYGRVADIEPKPLMTDELRLLQALTNRRSQLIEMRLAEENRLAVAHPEMRKQIKKHLRWLLKQIEQLEAEITRQIKASKTWSETDRLLQSVPGVGEVLSSTLITELPELGLLSNKQLASLVGVAPFPRESGKQKGRRFCRGGRNSVRRVLYMATITATRFNPVIKHFYDRLLERGKLKKVALIACARKLITMLNAMVRNKTHWQVT